MRKYEVKTSYVNKMTVEDWDKLLKDETIFNRDSLIVLKRMLHGGNKATSSTSLSIKFGGSALYYSLEMDKLEERLLPYVNAENVPSTDRWTILFKGYSDTIYSPMAETFKIRPELYEALLKLDLSDLPLYDERMQKEMEKKPSKSKK